MSDSTTGTDSYRLGVGIVLIDAKGLILVCKRVDAAKNAWPYGWQMPQGGIDAGETPRQAGLRELEEETGIRSVEILSECRDWLTYIVPHSGGTPFKYKGQSQKWFLARFKGYVSEINLAQAHPEFLEFEWVTKDEVLERVVPFKKTVYKSVIREFKDWLA